MFAVSEGRQVGGWKYVFNCETMAVVKCGGLINFPN